MAHPAPLPKQAWDIETENLAAERRELRTEYKSVVMPLLNQIESVQQQPKSDENEAELLRIAQMYTEAVELYEKKRADYTTRCQTHEARGFIELSPAGNGVDVELSPEDDAHLKGERKVSLALDFLLKLQPLSRFPEHP